MKKTYLLSSVLLSTLPLTSVAEIPEAPARVMESPEDTNTQHNFHSPRHTLNGKDGQFVLDLYDYKMSDHTNNKLVYELYGDFQFRSMDGQTVLYSLGYDEGSIAFDLIHDDKKLAKYRGVSCSSTTTNCREDFIIELRHNKLDNSWEMTLQITDLQAAYDSRELLNFPKQIVSLNRIILE